MGASTAELSAALEAALAAVVAASPEEQAEVLRLNKWLLLRLVFGAYGDYLLGTVAAVLLTAAFAIIALVQHQQPAAAAAEGADDGPERRSLAPAAHEADAEDRQDEVAHDLTPEEAVAAALREVEARRPVQPNLTPPPPPPTEPASSAPMLLRHDDSVAAAQRKMCVPLAQWTNAVEVTPKASCVYISAQFGADEGGILAQRAEAQCEACFVNLDRALRETGRTMADLVHLSIHMVRGRCSLADYRHAEARHLKRNALPAMTFAYVPALATSNILIQIAAVAA